MRSVVSIVLPPKNRYDFTVPQGTDRTCQRSGPWRGPDPDPVQLNLPSVLGNSDNRNTRTGSRVASPNGWLLVNLNVSIRKRESARGWPSSGRANFIVVILDISDRF